MRDAKDVDEKVLREAIGAINGTKVLKEKIEIKGKTVDEVVARLQSALEHIDRDRLVVVPDCGLGLLTAKLAEDKLRVMCRAVAQI